MINTPPPCGKPETLHIPHHPARALEKAAANITPALEIAARSGRPEVTGLLLGKALALDKKVAKKLERLAAEVVHNVKTASKEQAQAPQPGLPGWQTNRKIMATLAVRASHYEVLQVLAENGVALPAGATLAQLEPYL